MNTSITSLSSGDNPGQQSPENPSLMPLPRKIFALQVQYAQIAADRLELQMEDALKNFTQIFARVGGQEGWAQFLTEIDEKTDAEDVVSSAYDFYLRHHVVDVAEEVAKESEPYGCFSYDLGKYEGEKIVQLHFTNRDGGEIGPLSQERIGVRKEELNRMLSDIRQKHPDAKYAGMYSWLVGLPQFQQLMPNSFVGSAYKPEIKDARPTNMATWGQFVNRSRGFNQKLAGEFLQKAGNAETEEDLVRAFPYNIKIAVADIEDFYGMYLNQ